MSSIKWVLVALVASAFAAQLIYRNPTAHEAKVVKDVFINETNDHRFDESIEVSILASRKRTGIQNAVVITDRYASVPVEQLEAEAAKLFKKLVLGEATLGRAILYLYSPKLKSLKIEVGYALEGDLPDLQVHRLEQAAKGFAFVDRFQDFWAELINTVNIEILEATQGLKPHASDQSFETNLHFLSGGAGIVAHDYTANPEDLIKQMGPPPSKTDFDGGESVEASLRSYLSSLAQGVCVEKTGVLSRSSRFFRTFTPMTEAQLKRNFNMYEKAGVDRIFTEGHFTYVFFKDDHPVLPVILVFEDGIWRVDEPRSWALFQRFEDSQKVFLKYPLSIVSSPLRSYVDARFGTPLYRKPTVQASMHTQDEALKPYFDYYWLERAASNLDRSLESNLWVDLDINTNLGRFSEFLAVLDKLVKLYPNDKRMIEEQRFYKATYKFDGPTWVHAIP